MNLDYLAITARKPAKFALTDVPGNLCFTIDLGEALSW
jgi:hypothetical protein